MSVTSNKITVQTRSPVVVGVRPVYQPPLFTQFHSHSKSVLSTPFSYAHQFSVKAKSSGGIYQEYTITAASPLTSDTPLVGSLIDNYEGETFDLDSTYYTSTTANADTITLRPKGGALPVGTSLAINASSHDASYGYKSYVGSLETSYIANYIAANAKVLSDLDTHTLDASIVFGLPNGDDGVGLGAQVRGKANNNNGATLDTAELGLHYRTKDFNAAVVTAGYMSRLIATWTQILSPHTTLAAQFESPLATPASSTSSLASRVLTLGTSHQIDADTAINIKTVIPEASVALYLEKRIGALNSANGWLRNYLPKGTFGLSLQSSAKKNAGGLGLASIDKYGLSFSLGTY